MSKKEVGKDKRGIEMVESNPFSRFRNFKVKPLFLGATAVAALSLGNGGYAPQTEVHTADSLTDASYLQMITPRVVDGGERVTDMKVYILYPGGRDRLIQESNEGVSADVLEVGVKTELNNGIMKPIEDEYHLRKITYAGPINVEPLMGDVSTPEDTSIVDNNTESWLKKQITDGRVPPNDGHRLYIIMLTSQATISHNKNLLSGLYCGFHAMTRPAAGAIPLHIAIIAPNIPGCNIINTVLHEIAEEPTDPGLKGVTLYFPNGTGGENLEEIADICSQVPFRFSTALGVRTATMPTFYSIAESGCHSIPGPGELVNIPK